MSCISPLDGPTKEGNKREQIKGTRVEQCGCLHVGLDGGF